jgi:TonB-linked SusC/RagA family outer membrane protein
MRKFTFWLSALFLVFGLNVANAQTKVISGKVTDNSGALPGVSVVIKGTTKGTQTDFDGKYSIQTAVGDVLVFSFVGMETTTRTVGTANVIDVKMSEGALALEEVIVVAYGTAKKADFTGSATKISSETLAQKPITNITRAIEGNSAGVIVNAGSGQPGAGQDIRIRGFGSVNASSSPFYVVDGSPYTGDISAINMGDVENVTILKDAASTAIYGNRAANGIILITTKKGRKGFSSTSLTITQGMSENGIPEYNRLNAFEYYPMAWESYRNNLSMRTSFPIPQSVANDIATGLLPRNASNLQPYLAPGQTGTIPTYSDISQLLGNNPFNVSSTQIVDNTGKMNPAAQLMYPEDLDWQKYLYRTGKRSSYDLTYNGGADKTDYYVSLGYLNEEGYTIKSDYQRYTGRINVNNQATEWFKTGLNIGGTITKSNQAEGSDGGSSFVNPFYSARLMGPIYPVNQHDPITGLYLYNGSGDKIQSETRPIQNGRNSYYENLWNDRIARTNTLFGKTYFEFKFLNDFKFTTNISIDSRNYNYERFDNRFIGDGATAGRGGRTNSLTKSININQLLNYNKSFGNHNVTALLGHENYDWSYRYLDGFRQGLVVDGQSELVNFTTTNSLTSYIRNYTTEGYFGRFDYNYNSRYYVSGSYRKDGSSKFNKEVRWGDFWSVGLSWRLDQENFMKDNKWFNQLKLKGSYGEVGNDSGIDYYAYQALYTLGRNNANESGFNISSLANNELTWESNNSFEAGLDFGIKDNRVEGSIVFYHKISDNLLFDVPLPLSTGVNNITKNAGTMFNEGIELTLSADIIKNENFKWNMNLNASTIKNEFTKLPGDKINADGTKYYDEIVTGTKKYRTGQSIYDYWLRDWRGVDPADGLSLYKFDEVKTPGTTERTIDGVLMTTNPNNALYHYNGSAIPDLIGAVTNTFNYKNFSLSVLVTYQVGGYTYDSTYANLMHSGSSTGQAWHTDILNRWQKPGDITNVPRVDIGQSTNISAASDRWLISSTYVNLKSMNLSYTLPKGKAEDWGIKSARVYVSGENLYLDSSRDGLNVQRSFNGTTDYVYSPARIISTGLNLTF